MKFSWKFNLIVAGFLISFITDGIFYSFGVFLPHLLTHFKTRSSETAWVGSLNRGHIQLIGLVVGPLTKQFGCTAVAVVGSVIAAIALFLSAFAVNILYLDFSYGILGGCAAGFCIHPAVIATTINFSKHRGLAVGLVTAGTGCGNFAFSLITSALIKEFKWNICFIICAAIILLVAILAFFLRPFNAYPCCCTLVRDGDPYLKPFNPCRCCGQRAGSSEPVVLEPAARPLTDWTAPTDVASTSSKENEQRTCCKNSFCNFCREIVLFFCNWRLLLDSGFVFMCLGGALVSLGLFVPPMFIIKYANERLKDDITDQKSAMLLSLMGVTNMVSRVILGYLTDQAWSNVLSVFIIGTLIGGATTIPLGFMNSYVALAIYSSAFGVCMGSVLSLRSSVVYELIGVELFHEAFGMYLLFTGIFAFIGPPLFGFVFEKTDYTTTFISTGVVILIGMLFLVFIPATDFCLRKIHHWRGVPASDKPPSTQTVAEPSSNVN